ncbi:RNA 2',3'-cyclic phosphodiesterase [Desulfotomaculum defluvii]
MNSIRLFIAIDIPPELKDRLTTVQDSLKGYTSGVKWVSQNNFHLTLKFLGDTPEDRCKDIAEAMRQSCQQFSSFTLSLQGLGTFPGRGKPKVLWMGIHGHKDILLALHSSLDKNLAKLGFIMESRRYSPHLTLARIKDFCDTARLGAEIAKHEYENFGQWQVTSIHLIQSTLTSSGPIYTTLETVLISH